MDTADQGICGDEELLPGFDVYNCGIVADTQGDIRFGLLAIKILVNE